MMKGDEVMMRAGPWIDQIPVLSPLMAESSVPLTRQATLILFAAPSFSLMSDDVPGV